MMRKKEYGGKYTSKFLDPGKNGNLLYEEEKGDNKSCESED